MLQPIGEAAKGIRDGTIAQVPWNAGKDAGVQQGWRRILRRGQGNYIEVVPLDNSAGKNYI